MTRPGGPGEPCGRMVSLGSGERVPYPTPIDTASTARAKGNRRSGTKPEVAVRSEIHRRGMRFRKDFLVRCSNGVRVRVDIAFTRTKVAVFIDGCFWHRCPRHGTRPRRNEDYWGPKLDANVRRDRIVEEALRADGWTVERLWEHVPVDEAAVLIEAAVRRLA